jgi:hypothetical protein
MITAHEGDPPLDYGGPPIRQYVLRFKTRSGIHYFEELQGYSLGAVIVGVATLNLSPLFTQLYSTITCFEVEEK